MLTLENIHKSFDGTVVLEGIDLQVEKGEVLALLGPSGSGKSTLLSIVAGLETPDRGRVLWNGRDLAAVPAHRRGFGLMFQDFALFPHRDVSGNVAFGLQMAGWALARIEKRVTEMLELVGLGGFERREVGALSGGEQQRVALARALAPQPRLLMLDEPLGSLDRALRARLQTDLAAILRRAGQTSIYVTHDQEEAYAIADRAALLDAGRLAQVATPEELYRRPASAFVARFLGMDNLLPGELRGSGRRATVETALGRFSAPAGGEPGPVTVLLRPDAFALGGRGKGKLRGTLAGKQFRGSQLLAHILVGDTRLAIELPSTAKLPDIGQPLTVGFNPTEALHVFPND
ncbi:MAG: ABC transporter ATP-binding protein [Anaerolineales bacterium]|nr:ABC transporter ATP-binding protein [Anaerolineales bacterium]